MAWWKLAKIMQWFCEYWCCHPCFTENRFFILLPASGPALLKSVCTSEGHYAKHMPSPPSCLSDGVFLYVLFGDFTENHTQNLYNVSTYHCCVYFSLELYSRVPYWIEKASLENVCSLQDGKIATVKYLPTLSKYYLFINSLEFKD